MNRKRPVGAMDACETNNGDFVESSSDSDNDGDDEDMDDVWDFIDNEEGKGGRRKREETAPPLTPDIKVDLREALSRGMAEQQVSQETKKAEKVQEYWEEIRETEMALRLK